MTYSAGNVILAADYNGFANDSANNIGNVWAVGSTDKGWGQSNIANVAAAGTVTATQWATLVNNLTTMGLQANVAITSRTAPTAGNTIRMSAWFVTHTRILTHSLIH